MNSMLTKPQMLWHLYQLDKPEEANDYLSSLGFIRHSAQEGTLMYKGRDEAISIGLIDGAIDYVTYKTSHEDNHYALINHALDNLGYILILDDQKPTSSFQRYDEDRRSLIAMVISIGIFSTYTTRLQQRLEHGSDAPFNMSISPP